MSTAENQTPKITPFEALRDAGLTGFGSWKQINATETSQGAIRGLHAEEMWKLVAVVEGEAFGAYVDVRPDSPSSGKVVTTPLTKGMQALVPHRAFVTAFSLLAKEFAILVLF